MNLNNLSDCIINDFMEDDIKLFMVGLKKISKSKRITQADLAEAIGKDQTTISNYYNGKTRPQYEYLEILSSRIGMTVDSVIDAGKKSEAKTPPDIELIKEIVKQTISEEQPKNIIKCERNKDHHLIVDKYKNQATAREINKKLVKIETLCPGYLDDLDDILTAKLRRLEAEKNPEKPASGESLTKRG